MKLPNYSTSDEPASSHRLGAIPVCSYSEIATILLEREGVQISPERVKQTCEIAERKIARALRFASPMDGPSHGDAVRSRQTTRPCNDDRAPLKQHGRAS